MSSKVFAFIVIAVFFGMLIGIGLYYNKKKQCRNSDDNVLAGRAAPLILVLGSLFATWVNSTSLIGYASTGYSIGIAGYWSSGCFMVATMWLGIWMIPRLRRMGITTVPEIFEHFFGPAHRITALILALGRDLGVIASISIAMVSLFNSIFEIGVIPSMVITVAVVVIFTVTGGMWAVLLTDTIQAGIIFLATTALIPIGIMKIGGWSAFTAAVPAALVNPMQVGVSQPVGWFFMGCFITFAYQTVLQRGLAAKDDKTAKQAFLYGGALAMLWYIVPFICGIVARVLYPDISADDAFMTLTGILGPYARVLFVVALLSACISTISSCILTTTSNLTLDLYKRFLHPEVSDRGMVWLQRVLLVVITVVCLFIGERFPYILELFWVGGRIMASGLAPVLLAIVFWPRARRAPVSTLAAMIAGALANIAAQAFQTVSASAASEAGAAFIYSLDPVLVGLPVCFLVLIAGVYFETKNQTAELLQSCAVKR